jgi:DNA ligase-associated metallophosphoesterase
MSVVQLHGEKLTLLPERAVWWENKRTLILSDLHLGKIMHFRKNGIQAPVSQIESELQRFATLIASYNPHELIMVGDLFHSSLNSEWELFCTLTQSYPDTTFTLVRGNHDRMPAYVLHSANIATSTLLVREPFIFTHEPVKHHTYYAISGHIHPSVSLHGKAKQHLRLPCFCITEQYMLLPAFGSFTGTANIKPDKNDRVFVIAQQEIIELKPYEKVTV